MRGERVFGEQVAFGDDHQAVTLRERGDSLAHAVEQFDLGVEHVLRKVNDGLNVAPRDVRY